jgi:hypothetical protein
MKPQNNNAEVGREGRGPSGSAKKKPYEPPQLCEWGSLIDLTRNGGLGLGDLVKGGTRHT